MTIQIYNTLTRSKEPFEPLDPPRVAMYNCGPTVYDYFHIGNARNFVVFDTIRRYLECRGYDVTFVQNMTDIDDKIINKANEEGVSSDEIAKRFTDAYFDEAAKLNILPADIHPKATEHVQDIIDFIQKLIDCEMAYESGGSVYYRVAKFDGYGKLSGNRIEDVKKGARVEVDENKENPVDFDLWKASKPGEPSWDSPWGPGRPGWHIECSAMCLKHLGETIDIHAGGTDLTFPHHENEIAQSEALTGKPMVKYWMHNGLLTIADESGQEVKMAKSLGNDMKIENILEKFDASAVRAFLLSAHFRSPLIFSAKALEEMETSTQRLRDGLETARKLLKMAGGARPAAERDAESCKFAQGIVAEFQAGMDDDFNTPKALAALHKAVAEIHEIRQKDKGGELSPEALDNLASLVEASEEIIGILGLDNLCDPGAAPDSADEADLTEGLLQLFISVRAQARKSKAFEIADGIRDGLDELGIVLEDHPQGTMWKKKSE